MINMKDKKPTNGQLAKENEDLKHKLMLMAVEVNRILKTFDDAVDEILDDATGTRLKLKISELNKPPEKDGQIILPQ